MSGIDTSVETLRKHRPLLLAMEAIGWFHMAGKARLEFLCKHGLIDESYDYKKWHKFENPPFPWDNLLEWTKRLYSPHDKAWPNSFSKFIEKHGGRNANDPGLLGLLQAAHGIVSGIEKNLPKNTSKYLNQTVNHMWLTSPWGHPKRNLLLDPPAILLPHNWKQLVGEIHHILEEACRLGAGPSPGDVSAWKKWREEAIGEHSFIRWAFLSTLAETRLPNNDVTLWDQSYVAAALFKSAVAGALLTGDDFPWNDWKKIANILGIPLKTKKGKNREFNNLSDDERKAINGFLKSKTRWRLLTVAIGTEHYEERAVKIGDWTGAQKVIEEFFQKVAELIEVDLAVGSMLYRDSSVAVFSFPGERFDENNQKNNLGNWLNGWEQWLQEQMDTLAQNLDLETPPCVRLSEPTRSLVPIVQEQKAAKESVKIPVHKQWDIYRKTSSESSGHVCPVCRVRLNGDPTSKTKPCQICRDRRHHRRNDWLQGNVSTDTIWFEEVADHNDRLALLTFFLKLEPWLEGTQVDSLRAQAIPEWIKFNPILSGSPNPIDVISPFDSLFHYIYTAIQQSFDKNDPVFKSLHDGYQYESKWEVFFQKIVEDRVQKDLNWKDLYIDQRAAWFAHQLFVKLPSPGRVYRFWREAEAFFRDLLRAFRQIASRHENHWRTRRLLLIPEDRSGWVDHMLYNGQWRGNPFSLLYVEHLSAFITISNLARSLKAEETPDVLRNIRLRLKMEDESRQSKTMTVKEVTKLKRSFPHLNIYTPVILLNLSPIQFRVIVPLNTASECIDTAIDWWKERFARVWDRLPLHIGVVAFSRTIPYQAVIEAVRNIEDILQDQKASFWRVVDIEKHPDVISLVLNHDHQTLHRLVPVTLPDGRKDVFYPYVEVDDTTLRFPKDFRHPNGPVFRHVEDLRRGDGIKVYPSGICTVFMDSTASRFHIESPQNPDEWQRMREDWELLKRIGPSRTALQHLRSAITNIDFTWRNEKGEWEASKEIRRETYRALLVHHLENPPPTALEHLTQSAVKGRLLRTIQWHLIVLKE